MSSSHPHPDSPATTMSAAPISLGPVLPPSTSFPTATPTPVSGSDTSTLHNEPSSSSNTNIENDDHAKFDQVEMNGPSNNEKKEIEGSSSPSLDEKQGLQTPGITEKSGNGKGYEDLGNGKVFYGVEKETGKAIIKDKLLTDLGQPYTEAKFRHFLKWIPGTRPKHPPQPPKASLDDAPILPDTLQRSNFFSILFFSWIGPLMALGARRQLTAEDLFKIAPEWEPEHLAGKLTAAFQRRWDEAEKYNAKLEGGEVKVPFTRKIKWALGKGKGKNAAEKEHEWRTISGKRNPSLAWSLSDVFGLYYWGGGMIKTIGDTCQISTTLVLKQLVTFSTQYHAAQAAGTTPPSIGKGIGFAILLYCLLQIASLANNHFFARSMLTGVHSRGALITAVFDRSMRLSPKSRLTHTTGKLTNHLSTDISRVDFAAGLLLMAPCGVIQFIIIAIVLLAEIGYSALVGLALCLMMTPIQTYIMARLLKIRQASMVYTDQRASLLQELLNGMRTVKLYAYEGDWLDRLSVIRGKELGYVRRLMVIRGLNIAIAQGLPVLAAILSFILYASTNHALVASQLFLAITAFQLTRLPLIIMPLAIGACVDAGNACKRLEGVFKAELQVDQKTIEPGAPYGLKVSNASFTWETSAPVVEEDPKKKKKRLAKEAAAAQAKAQKKAGSKKTILGRQKITPAEQLHAEIAAGGPGPEEAGEMARVAVPGIEEGENVAVQREVFQLRDIDLEVPQGALVAIVGPIGSGKSSFISAILGEMRRTEGKPPAFGGKAALCSQVPWIINATVRENILFGMPFEEERYWQCVRECCLEPDLDAFPDGDAEIIGEKGINLSGGQKARVNLCRAIYYDASVVIMDDPLAAVDPGISAGLFWTIHGLQGKTRILVTHALHFLPHVDFVVTIAEGRIAEQGTYQELKDRDGTFAALMREFANEDEAEEKKGVEEEAVSNGAMVIPGKSDAHLPPRIPRERLTASVSQALMSTETMNQGGLRGATYSGYLKAGNGFIMVPLLLAAVVLNQIFTVVTAFWLVWWQETLFPFGQGVYEGVYVALGFCSAISVFLMTAVIANTLFLASNRIHADSIQRIMHAPMSFFDTTPLGRIMNRLTKDIDTIDNTLGDNFRQFSLQISTTAGTLIIIAIVDPVFLAPVAVIGSLYFMLARYYQKSALMFKRIDAILRSPLYSHFSESLTGQAVIRAYGETNRFLTANRRYMANEQRPYVLSIYNQRWLGVRLDFLGCLLSFIVALIVVLTRGLSPAKGGLILSYIVSTQQIFSWLIRQTAEVSNDMNSAERLLEYANELEQEAPHVIPETQPPASWPSQGKIEFKNVVMSYREGLPPVLKNLSLSVGAAERIGVVGRTGAGKSSIMSTLFRLVEISSGSIEIDGIDISKIGLTALRSKLSIIPQEAFLYSGTIRTNLDPFGMADDQTLWDAMRRAHLIEGHGSEAGEMEEKGGSGTVTPSQVNARAFTLDTVIEDEGSNLSVGERSLVSLARALVRDARVCILDECTAAVDLETDAKIQHTIMTQFTGKTLLTIAHRIRTILAYDRILVLSAGQVEEFDTPLNLFLKEGVFHTMCMKSSITLEDVKHAGDAYK